MSSNYVRGRSREYRVMKRLREMGAVEVTRSYASKGPWDIRAIFPTHLLLVQVKKQRIGRRELASLIKEASKLKANNFHVQVWQYPKGKLEVHSIQ